MVFSTMTMNPQALHLDAEQETRRIVESAGVSVPEQVEADDADAVKALLDRHGSLVVKPAPSLSTHCIPTVPRMHTSARRSPFTSPIRSVP